MSNYKSERTTTFDKDLKKIKSDFQLQRRLENKMDEILADPHHYKHLRNVLKNYRRVHIGSFVLIFEVKEADKTVIFHSFEHHDEAYKK